ncbi:MAG: YhjD/YihY/BrkB family envelope integrity protein [Planctomycetota bacterium]
MSSSRRHPPGSLGSRALAVGHFFSRDVWARELTTLPTFNRWCYKVARVSFLAASNFVKDRCTWRASALTYITVLSLVPMLAFAFSVAKGLGAYETLRTGTIDPLLDRTFGTSSAAEGQVGDQSADAEGDEVTRGAAALEAGASAPAIDQDGGDGGAVDRAATGAVAPAGSAPADAGSTEVGSTAVRPTEPDPAAPEPKSPGGAEVREAIDTVLHFVQETNVASLGALGLAIVVWTVLSLLGSIERSFNDIWGVRRSRTIARKLSDYLSTIVLVPLFLVSATGLANVGKGAKVLSWLGIDVSSSGLSFLVVLPVVALGFAFAYVFMPNTRVRITSALLGGIVGGTLWQLFQMAHLKLQLGVANYNAIYSTFAALPIFLFWVYASWVTVLLGAEVAAAHQNEASHRQVVRARDYDPSLKRVVALRLAVRLARAFLDGGARRPVDEYAEELGVPDRTLDEVVSALRAGGLLAVTEPNGDEGYLVLTRDPNRARVQDVYDALDGVMGPSDLRAENALDDALDRAVHAYDVERRAAGANKTLAELARSAD